MGQAFTEVFEAHLQALVKGLKLSTGQAHASMKENVLKY